MNFFRNAAIRNSLLIAIGLTLLFLARPAHAQDNPVFKIDESVTRFAFSGGGRIVYSVRHVFSEKKIQLQRDDIWIAERDGKKRRILQGEKFIRGTMPFSYTVRSLCWSPDGTKIAAELATSMMINNDGDTREGVATLLLDDSGREIQVAGGDSVIDGASNAAWLPDGTTLVDLTELQKPAAAPARTRDQETPQPIAPLERSFSVTRTNIVTGKSDALFSGTPVFGGRLERERQHRDGHRAQPGNYSSSSPGGARRAGGRFAGPGHAGRLRGWTDDFAFRKESGVLGGQRRARSA